MATRTALATLVGLAGWWGQPPAARAQISPNCLLNGRPLACAITPGPDGPRGADGLPSSSTLTVMYADGQAYRLNQRLADCRQRGAQTLCPATITTRNGFGTTLQGRYVASRYEGGTRHEYQAGPVRIQYVVVD